MGAYDRTLASISNCVIITQKRTELWLSTENVERWVVSYKLREKLRCSPDVVEQLRNPTVRRDSLRSLAFIHTLQETHLLFNSYVGAVYATQGIVVVQNWIGALVDPEYAPQPDVERGQAPAANAA